MQIVFQRRAALATRGVSEATAVSLLLATRCASEALGTRFAQGEAPSQFSIRVTTPGRSLHRGARHQGVRMCTIARRNGALERAVREENRV